jgi:hypothetical protein
MALRRVVLLKDGALNIEECESEAIFALARTRNAGICGVFGSYAEAAQFIHDLDSSSWRERIVWNQRGCSYLGGG